MCKTQPSKNATYLSKKLPKTPPGRLVFKSKRNRDLFADTFAASISAIEFGQFNVTPWSSDNNPVHLVLYPHTMLNSLYWMEKVDWTASASEILSEETLEESGQSTDSSYWRLGITVWSAGASEILSEEALGESGQSIDNF